MPTDLVRNEHMIVTVALDDPRRPMALVNASMGTELLLSLEAPAFHLREGLVGGPDVFPAELDRESGPGGERVVAHYEPQHVGDVTGQITAVFTVADNGRVLRKHATLRLDGVVEEPLLLERVILVDDPLPGHVVFSRDDAAGYPVLTDDLFLGVAFPAGQAVAADGRVTLSHAPWRHLATGETYRTRDAVVAACARGTARQAFEDYILSLRPTRSRGMHFNYNTWFTLGLQFTAEEVTELADRLRTEFVERHGATFDSFTIDLGWSRREGVWEVDEERFPQGLGPLDEAVTALGSRLGLWVSPLNHYSPHTFDNDWAADAGFETMLVDIHDPLGPAEGREGARRLCCLAGDRYRQATRDALMLRAAEGRIDEMKLDAFLHVCPADDHGHAPGAASSEAVAQGLLEVLEAVRETVPGAWLESLFGGPWLLSHVDSVNGAVGDDYPPGAVPAPVYRDSYTTGRDFYNMRSFDLLVPTWAQSLFGIIHQTPEPLHDDAAMSMLRGNQFVSLYVHPEHTSEDQYRYLAELMVWARANEDLLSRTQLLWTGPVPQEPTELRSPYGYAHWGDGRGLVCVRNPWIETATMEVPVSEAGTAWQLYPYRDCLSGELRAGETLPVVLGAYETRVIAFGPRQGQPQPDVVTEQSAAIDARERDGVIHGNTPANCSLYCVVESPDAPVEAMARVIVDGAEADVQVLDSEDGWSSASLSKSNHWRWFVVRLPEGSWEASVAVDPPVSYRTWVVHSYDAPEQDAPSESPAFPLWDSWRGQVAVAPT